MLNLLGSIAEFERELMLERQRDPVKPEGKTGDAIAAEFGIGRARMERTDYGV
jgi:DNA invertase Pin-like site-specific DNA recombinase